MMRRVGAIAATVMALQVGAALADRATPEAVASASIACRGETGPALILRQSQVVAWPSGRSLLDAGPEAVSLACDDAWLVVGLRSGRGGEVHVYARSGSETLSATPRRLTLRFVPRRLRVVAGVATTWRMRKKQAELFLLDLSADRPWISRPLRSIPAALGATPGGRALLVAVGSTLRSYAVGSFLSGEIIPFGAPITALAARADGTRWVVATGKRVVSVDALDTRRRGELRPGAEITLPGRVTALALPGEGGPIAAVIDSPPRLVFLSPTSLAPLEWFDLDRPGDLLVDGPGRVLTVFPDGEVQRLELSVPWQETGPPAVRRAAPAVPVADRPQPPPPAIQAAAAADPPPAPLPAPAEPPAATTPPAPPRTPSAPPPPPEPAQPPLDLSRLPAGCVAGLLEGRADLVEEIVFQGPDNLLQVARRVVPERLEGRVYYRAEQLAEGDYRVVPMGSGGSSLRCLPPHATVHVGGGEGSRVDFRILGSW